MKKLVLIAVFIFMASNAFADASEYTTGYKNGFANGRFIEITDSQSKDHGTADQFIMGIIQGFYYLTDDAKMKQLYPAGTSYGDIVKAVRQYYVQNPSKKYTLIVDVINSGCK